MEIYSVDYIPNRKYRMVGLVKGNIVQSKNVVSDLGAGLKTIVGGEIIAYSDMLTKARNIATQRMIDHAKELGANGVIGVKYTSGNIMQNTAEVLAFGTAVIFED